MSATTLTYKEKLLQAGTEMLWAQGFNDTGIQELANKAGVPKGSFYNYFASKEIFAVAVIEHYGELMMTIVQEALSTKDKTPLNRLLSLYSGWAKDFYINETRGCLVANLTSEVSSQRPQIREALGACYDRFRHKIVDTVELAQKSKEVNDSMTADYLGTAIHNGWHGALTQAKSQNSNEPLLQFCQLFLPHILGLKNDSSK